MVELLVNIIFAVYRFADFFHVAEDFFVSSLFHDPDQFEPVKEELKLAHTIGLCFCGFFHAYSAQATAPGFLSYPEGELPQSLPLGEYNLLLGEAFQLPFEFDF